MPWPAAGAKPDKVASQTARQMVTGCLTQPGEVANLVVFLASDQQPATSPSVQSQRMAPQAAQMPV